MLQGQDILCISSIDWDFNWQGHQEIMATLAEHGNRVLFVENTGVRAPRLQDLPRFKRRIARWWRSTKGFQQERPNLSVYSPLILPFPYSSLARRINRFLLLRALRRWMRAVEFQRPIVWTFLPTGLVVDLIDGLDPVLVVYYCIADFDQLTPRPGRLARSERALLARTDVVFVQGEALRRRCPGHPNVHVFPFGVRMEAFERTGPPAPELRALTPPIVGYVGGIHRHVDLDLVTRLAREVEGTLALVGPVQTDADGLRGRPNVAFLGLQPHARIPEFVRAFDVGIIPYRLTEFTRTVYPTKLNEYLAAGLPVVSTDLAEVRRFNAEHGDVVTIAADADAFVEAVRAASEKSLPAARERRIEVARQNSWGARIAQMSDRMEAALAAKEAARPGWEDTLRRLYRSGRRRILQTVGAAVAVYLLVFHTPAVWLMAEPLRVADPPRPVEAIVVIAGGAGESGKAGGGYQERVKHAVDLYRAGYAPRLIFSSGFVFAFREAEVMKGLAVALGVPPEAVLLEEKAASTYENVVFVRNILEERGWGSVLVVSSPYHMRRAMWTFRKSAPGLEVVASPVPQTQFYAHEGGASLEQIGGILHEYAAIAHYWWKGRL